MGMQRAFRTEILKYLFQNIAVANIGDASGLQPSASDGNLYIALHTAQPDRLAAGDNQESNEVTLGAYPTYARVAVPRNTSEWEVADNRARNVNAVAFPEQSGGSSPRVTWVSIGLASSGTGALVHMAPLGPTDGDGDGLLVADGVVPTFAAGALAVYYK